MIDRGIIKWQPFDSVMSSNEIKKIILSEKAKVNKPQLSEDQQIIIEQTLLEAWHNNIKLTITYFKNNKIYKLDKKILKIISINKKIIFEDYFFIYFDQILKVSI
ncbi:MAG: YolD-like family protein [Bacilli bacterium]|nr:YolD-like family protein [Bacilli bacterium]